MICSNCKTPNDDQYVFCVNCGERIVGHQTVAMPTSDEIVPPTVREIPKQHVPIFTPETSDPTVFAPPHGHRPSAFMPTVEPPRRSPVLKILAAGIGLLILLGIVGVGGYLAWAWQKTANEVLPDHLGMFAQNRDRNHLDEIKKLDFTSALEGKENLLKDDGLPSLDSTPTLILYSDAKDVPVSDLRLIQLDSIKDDGSFKQIDFQASPIEGKPEMKRLRVPDGVANGKYAFALIDGYLNDGKHKFWPFQVRNASRSDNGNGLRAVTVALKPTPTPTPTPGKTPGQNTPVVPPPNGATVAYCTTGNLILRSGPSQSSGKIRNLRRGEKVYVLRYSENTEVFQGLESKFAYVQTEGGQSGWVFAAFLR